MTDEELLERNRAGVPARQLARQLGVNKNVICGRLYRQRQKTADTEVIDQFERNKRNALAQAGTPRVKDRKTGRKAIGQEKQQLVQGGGDALALVGPRDCRYPIGTPGSAGFKFCRQPRHLTRPYCLHHLRLCIQVDKATTEAMPI